MIFREWTEKDLPEILALERACFAFPWTEEMLVSSFRSPLFWGVLAEEDGEILGYLGGETLYELSETLVVAVKKSARNKGLATELFARFEKEAREKGAEKAMLEVRVSNTAARALYEKLGYAPIAVRKKYYPDNGEDAIVMSKEL